MKKNICIIPSYKPDTSLLELLARFSDQDEIAPLVVDDGSGCGYDDIFTAAEEYAIVLHHAVNKGKGAALKTAIAYINESLPDAEYAVTADSDGQHTFAQIETALKYAREYPNALVLGGRRFEGNVPFRSRFGNSVTRKVFAVASGVHVYDTQTGLRAFSRSLFNSLLSIKGDRYEYEMNTLLEFAQRGIPIAEFEIETIYLNDNKASHFNPLRDSIKIYACILKYGISSILSFLIDYGIFVLLSNLLDGQIKNSLFIGFLGARIISSVFNFFVNKKMVFNSNEKTSLALVKYFLLVVISFICDYFLMKGLVAVGVVKEVAKIISGTIIFIANMIIQGLFVFRKKDKQSYIKL